APLVTWGISLWEGLPSDTLLTERITQRLRRLVRAHLAVDDAGTSAMLEPACLRDTVRSSRGRRPPSEGLRAMMHHNDAPVQLNRLYEEFFERGLQYFFPFATFQPLGTAPPGPPETVEGNAATAVVRTPWLGAHYALHNPVPFTAHDRRMLDSVRAVLT